MPSNTNFRLIKPFDLILLSDEAVIRCSTKKASYIFQMISARQVYLRKIQKSAAEQDAEKIGNLFNGKWFKTVRNHFWGEFFVL